MNYIKSLFVTLCLVLFGASQALAVLSAEQQAVTDAVDTMITDLTTWGWTAVLAIATFTIGVKIFRKVLHKSTT